MPSSFTSPVPGSAIWGSGSQECRATGRAVLSDLRAGLLWERTGSMSSSDASAAVQAASDDAAATGWSTTTLNALAALLTRYGQTAYAGAVRANITRGGAFSRQTMQAVLWGAYSIAARTVGGTTSNIHSGSPSSYTFDADAQLPMVGSLAPTPLDGVTAGISCVPAGSKPGPTQITQTGVAAINPLLLAVLIVATAAAGVIIMSTVRKKHGESW
jgi:hypothetical protein